MVFAAFARASLTAVLLFLSFSANAQSIKNNDLIVIEAGYGNASPGNPEFSNSPLVDASLGYMSKGWVYRVGVSLTEGFELDERKGEASIEAYGVYLQAVKIIDLNWLNLELGAGVYRNTLKAFLELDGDRREVGRSNEVDPFASAFLVKDLNQLLSVQLGYKYLDDVGGDKITMTTAGMRVRF